MLGGDDVTVSDEGVLVKRALTCKDGWIIGMIRIESSRQERVLVHVVDEFPDSLPAETVGFKRGVEREMNEISVRGASIKQPVDDEPVAVTYGIKLAETVTDVEFEPPAIQCVESAGSPHSATARTDSHDSSDGDGKRGKDLWGAAADAPAPTAPIPKSALTAMCAIHDDPTDGAGDGSDTAVALSADSEDSNGATTTDRTEQRHTRRSIETRVDRLSARVEKFAAYSTALEGLIDDHGTAPEFIDRVENDLEECERQLHAVETEIEGLNRRFGAKFDDIETDISTQSGAIGRVKSDIKALDERVTGVEDELTSLREEFSELQATIDEFSEFKESLADVFGPSPGGSGRATDG